jgi:hypothetical protein
MRIPDHMMKECGKNSLLCPHVGAQDMVSGNCSTRQLSKTTMLSSTRFPVIRIEEAGSLISQHFNEFGYTLYVTPSAHELKR